MTPGGGDYTTPLGPFRPEPDELDRRVRSVNAERLRPAPTEIKRERPRDIEADSSIHTQLVALVALLAQLEWTPPDGIGPRARWDERKRK